jgi:hypothetical protein
MKSVVVWSLQISKYASMQIRRKFLTVSVVAGIPASTWVSASEGFFEQGQRLW